MKTIILSGSMAYDRTMSFPDLFRNHLLPDQLDKISVSFMVSGATEEFGGTAGNIAYGLKLMGEEPILSATLGRDHFRYSGWLDACHIKKDRIIIIEDELSAGCYITNDVEMNQFTIFNPGAMKMSSRLDFDTLVPEETLLLISPGNLDDMMGYPVECQKRGIEYIFDPGQNIPVLPPEGLMQIISKAKLLIVNEYECKMLMEKLELSKDALVKLAQNSIVTLGSEGSELFTDTAVTKVPACESEGVVDPTGAGDAYRAGLISGLTQGKSLQESALLGSVCGSFAVEYLGTQKYRFDKDGESFRKRLNTLQ